MKSSTFHGKYSSWNKHLFSYGKNYLKRIRFRAISREWVKLVNHKVDDAALWLSSHDSIENET